MRLYKYIILIILAAHGMGCQKQNRQIINIPSVDTLYGSLFHRGVDDMLVSNDFKITDSCVLAINLSNNSVFNCYPTFGDCKITHFGNKGNARDEFVFPIFANNYRSTNNCLSVFDIHKGNLVNIIPNVSDHKINIDQRQRKLINSFNINIIDENTIVGNKVDASEGLFYIYNTEKGKFSWIEYNDDDIKLDDVSEYELYYNVLDYSRVTNEVVVALRYFNKILFYSIDQCAFKEVQIGNVKRQPRYDPLKKGLSLDKSAMNFLDICVSGEYIYCLMLNQDGATLLLKLNVYGKYINCAYLDRNISRVEIFNNEYAYGIGDDGTGLADIMRYNISNF